MNPDEEMKQLRALQKTVEEIVLGNTAGPVNAPEAVRRALVSLKRRADAFADLRDAVRAGWWGHSDWENLRSAACHEPTLYFESGDDHALLEAMEDGDD